MSDSSGSRAGEIVRAWGDEDRTFRLGIGEWRKVQEKCDAGPPELARRLGGFVAAKRQFPRAPLLDLAVSGGLGAWNIDDVREPLLQGLIGGGLNPTEAGRLVRDLFDGRPLFESVPLALEVVLAGIIGPEDEPLGKSPGEAGPPPDLTSPAES